MKNGRFSDAQIMAVLKQAEGGVPVSELCREHGIPVVEREIPEARLHDADEIWVSSSTKDVVPITCLNDRPVGDGRPGATWKTLSRHYIQFKRRLCGLD